MKNKLSLITMLLMLAMYASAAQTISVDDVNVTPGSENTLTVHLKGASNCVACGFTLVLPDGALDGSGNTPGYTLELGTNVVKDHILVSEQLGKNQLKVAIYSLSNSVFKNGSSDDVLLNVKFMGAGCKTGSYKGYLRGFELSSSSHQLIRLSEVTFNITVGTGGNAAYAWLSSDGKKLTFCYDANRSGRVGTTFDLNTGANNPGWSDASAGITTVHFNNAFASARPTSCYRWFYGMTKLATITNLSNLNTSKVTNMTSMFNKCGSLKALDVSTLSTAKATALDYMFNMCTGLTELNISAFTLTSSQTSANMLKGCSGLTSLTVPSTANFLDATACVNVGTQSSPCTLVYPSGFTPEKDATDSGWYQWKSGYFKDAPTEAYACLSSDGKKLTFCYDGRKTLRDGTIYALNTGTNAPGWSDASAGITTVYFNNAFASARPTSCYRWFYGMTNLTTITNLSNLNTSKVTNMTSMFNKCGSLTSLDLSTLSTAKAKALDYMFNMCTGLTELNISAFTLTSSQTSANMLKGCSGLTLLTVPSTANYLDATACTGVGTQSSPCTLVYPSGFTPEKDATGSGWYQWKSGYFKDAPTEAYAWLSSDGKKLTFCYDGRKTLRDGTIYALNTGTNAPGWFDSREGVTSVVFNNAFASARPTSCYRWFYGMTNLTTITNLSNLNTSKVTNMTSMFNKCGSLTSLDVSTLSTAKATALDYMFNQCSGLTSLDISKFTLTSSQVSANMMKDCSSLKTLTVPSTANYLDATACVNVGTQSAPCTLTYPSGFTPQKDATGSGWYQWKTGYFKDASTEAYAWLSSDGKKLTFCYDAKRSSRDGMTFDLNTGANNPGWSDASAGITTVYFNNAFSSARPTSCYRWFYGMTKLATITNLSNLNTSKVTNMTSMFNKCGSLTSLDVSTISTAKATALDYMFNMCTGLTSLDISAFTLTSSKTSANMLKGCSSLTSLTVPSTANYLDATACTGIGTQSAPCTLTYPSGFTPEKDATGSGWYQWKTGYFKDASTEAYAWLSSDGKKLTFCYDAKRSSRVGTTFALNTGANNPGWSDASAGITTVYFNNAFASARPTSCYRWFYGMTKLATITNLSNLNTSKVTNMTSMFNKCGSLTSLDVSTISTAKATALDYMFNMCTGLTSLDISAFTLTSSQTSANMLKGCSGLTLLTVPSTANYLDATVCTGVGTQSSPCTLVYPSGFTPEKDATGSGWYQWKSGYFKDAPTEAYAWLSSDGKKLTFCYDGRKTLRDGTIYALNTGTNAPGWFDSREGVTSVVFNNAFASARPTSCYRWFYGMTNLTTITNLSNLNTSKVTNMTSMFNKCGSLTSLDVSTLSTAKVTALDYMFNQCSGLTSLDLSKFTLTSSQASANMLKDCSSLKTLTVPSTANYLDATACVNVGTQSSPCTLSYPSGFTPQKDATGTGWYQWRSGYFKDSSSASAYAWLSSDGKKLTFCYDANRSGRAGTTYDLNTGTNAPGWSDVSAGITTVYFNNAFASARPTTCYRWFYGMTNLTTITNLGNLNTSKATNMASMFNACSSLTSLDVSTFNTALVTTMNYMFYKCSKLTSLTVGSLSVAKSPTMKYVFASCSALTSLDLSGITFSSSLDTEYMLKDCSALTTLTIPSSASYLNSNACTNVGTQSSPCTLVYPSGFTPQKDATGSGWYKWKAGCFTDPASAEAYAWLSSDGKKLTFCYDTNRTGRAGTTYDLNTGTDAPGWSDASAGITTVYFNNAFASARPTTCYRWFYGMTSLTTITNLKNLNTSKATNMASMFNRCSSLTSLDVSTFSTALVTTMNYMFYKCSGLTTLKVGSLSVAKSPTMEYMFASCSALTSLDLSGITFNSLLDTEYLLKDCSALTTLTVPVTANYLSSNACTSVGTKTSPCTLVHSSSFTPDKMATGTNWYQWKTGYFISVTGDANGYGEVTVSDIQMAMEYVLGKDPDGIVLANAEVTCDGEVTLSDVSAIADLVVSRPSVPAARARESVTDMVALTSRGDRCTVHLSASAPYHAFQMTVVLPEGARMGNVLLADGRANGHHVQWMEVSPGRYNVVCWSVSGDALRDGPTALLHFDVSGCKAGDVSVENVQMVDSWCETVLLPATSGITTGLDWIVDDFSEGTGSPYYNTMGIGSKVPQRGVNIKDGRKTVVVK